MDTPAQPTGHFTCFHALLALALLVGVVAGGRIGWARGGWVGLLLGVVAAIPLTVLACAASFAALALVVVLMLRVFDPEALRRPAPEPRDAPSKGP